MKQARKIPAAAQVAQVARLALADARHEWRMSLCLALAVAAIAAPLLLFFGLRHGTVETLRKRLLDNPVTLEIMPVTDRLLDDTWFAAWRADARVAFVVPHTRKLSAQADLSPAGGKTPVRRVDVQPTTDGDVLLERNGLAVPAPDHCVLSERAALQLGVGPGARVTMAVTRDQARVRATREFTVSGVLPAMASQLPSAYIPLEQLEAIESFKDGRSVPAFGWPGSDALAYPVLPSLLVVMPKPLDATREALLLQNTGFASLEKPDAAALAGSLSGLGLSSPVYRLKTVGGPASWQNIQAARDKLRGLGALLVPESGNARLEIPPSGGEPPLTLRVLPGTGLDAPLPGYALRDGLSLEEWSSFTAAPARVILVSPAVAQKVSDPARAAVIAVVRTQDGERSLAFTAALVPDDLLSGDEARIPVSLLGVLNLLEQRPILDGKTEKGEEAFLLGRRGYSGFRMYASALETVASLAESLEREGIRVSTRADRIGEVLSLDKYLGLLFWVIAAVTLAGGTACLLASIYANVERKRRDLAVLRLLGVHGGGLAVFPLVGGITLTLAGFALSLCLFHLFSLLINVFFGAQLGPGEQFCALTSGHQAAAALIALALACVAGLAASRRFASIDPAESLRDE